MTAAAPAATPATRPTFRVSEADIIVDNPRIVGHDHGLQPGLPLNDQVIGYRQAEIDHGIIGNGGRHRHHPAPANDSRGMSPGLFVFLFLLFVVAILIVWWHYWAPEDQKNMLRRNWNNFWSTTTSAPPSSHAAAASIHHIGTTPAAPTVTVRRDAPAPAARAPSGPMSALPTPEQIYSMVPHKTTRVCVPCVDGYEQNPTTCDCTRRISIR